MSAISLSGFLVVIVQNDCVTGIIDWGEVASGSPINDFASVLTHMLPDAIENYLRQSARVLVSGGSAFISVLLFDLAAETAVRNGTTIFDFRHQIGPCLTFDPQHPEEGIACGETWFFQAVERSGLRLASLRRGNWRNVRSYAITQDYVVAEKA